jgi:hypothetical protein
VPQLAQQPPCASNSAVHCSIVKPNFFFKCIERTFNGLAFRHARAWAGFLDLQAR